ncbi:MAG: ATP synthase F0 subunit B [Clostridiales bacterium]|jgi:F-type H+-transporting ATPase subunit b|nr:ATP synthase F0 subunit B [Clostridiales bacterium]
MGAAGAAAGLPDGVILSLDKSLLYNIAIQLFNVAVLTVALIFLLYKPVRKFLAERRQTIRAELEEARAIRDEALEQKEQYEKLIAGIESEREEILRQTHKRAMEKSDQMLFDARREAEVIYSRAQAELELERENLNDEMKRQIIEISHMMAGRFVQVSMDRAAQDRFIEHALSEWSGGGNDDGEGGEGEGGDGR